MGRVGSVSAPLRWTGPFDNHASPSRLPMVAIIWTDRSLLPVSRAVAEVNDGAFGASAIIAFAECWLSAPRAVPGAFSCSGRSRHA